MTGFRFRLERLLQLRSRTEQERAAELGAALRDEEVQQAALEAAVARLGRVGEQILENSERVTTAGVLRNQGLTLEAAARQIEEAECSHDEAVEAVEDRQERYGEARKDRRVIERLRERRLAAWETETQREEQKETDGIARRRHQEGKQT